MSRIKSEELLMPALLYHKEPARRFPMDILRSKVPSRGLWMRRAGSFWHKRAGASNSSDLILDIEVDQSAQYNVLLAPEDGGRFLMVHISIIISV